MQPDLLILQISMLSMKWPTMRSPASPATTLDQACPPYTVDVMTRRQKLVFRSFSVLWLLSFVSFWHWWLQESHVVTVSGLVVNSILLAWVTGQIGWYLYFVNRMKMPNPESALPMGRIAMIVTKAPSEPWPVVRETLEAMLHQEYDAHYDVWLADEDVSEETRGWCAAHGVQVSCRKGVPGYHNQNWPGRTRCKEGNLKYFYDRVGYAAYDYVVQLDADHVPEAGYLREMIRPFGDPRVGYVAAPSICDKNAATSWAARARLYAEGPVHGALQAGYSNGFAPLCIGSHYAVRTHALQLAGGLGPELAEDHSTTLMLNAAGWRGAFALQAIAHGDGPTSIADLLTQEFQWSRSLVNILLSVSPRYWRKLPAHLKLQFGFVQLLYVFISLAMVCGHALPLIGLVRGTPWVNVNLLDFYMHGLGMTLTTTLIGEWLRQQGWFRPHTAKLISWEVVLFQFVKWPWVLLGVCYAVGDSLLKREFAFKVTPKGATGARPLASRVLAPYTALAIIEAGVAVLVKDAGQAGGYYYLAIVYSMTYVAVLAAIIGLHVHEQEPRRRLPFVMRPITQAAAAMAVAGMAVALRWEAMLHAVLPAAIDHQPLVLRIIAVATP